MATSQIHHDLRFDLTQRIALMLQEKATLAPGVARNTALGDPSSGDGGTAATGEFAIAVDALAELIDPTEGDPDFDGLTPVFGTFASVGTIGNPINIGPAGSGLQFSVAHVLPFPLIEIDPVGAGSNVNVSDYCKLSWSKTSFTGAVGQVSVCSITLSKVPAFAGAQFTIRVSNPKDAASAVAISAPIYLVATA